MIDYSFFPAYKPQSIDEAEVCSLSGGRSSAFTLMSLINGGFGLRKNNFVSFQNTGKEDETCYEFIKQIEKSIEIPVFWLEYSLSEKFVKELLLPSFDYDKFNSCGYNTIYEILNVEKIKSFDYAKTPSNFWYKEGYSNKKQSIKQVDFYSASRNGKPFTDTFLYKCAIRIMKGKGFFLPSAGQRWCTGDMKEKVLHQWLSNNNIKEYTKYLGIRHDEQSRVHRILAKNDKQDNVYYVLPLNKNKIIKADVMLAWRMQNIDLGFNSLSGENGFRDFIGNCVYCHLKSKIKKLYLMQQGYSSAFYRQMEAIVNNYNQSIDAMSRTHGTYETMEKLAHEINKIDILEVLNSEEIEFSCTGCGD